MAESVPKPINLDDQLYTRQGDGAISLRELIELVKENLDPPEPPSGG